MFQRGFIGLLSLLVTLAIISFLVWKLELKLGQATPKTTSSIGDILDSARNAKSQLENHGPSIQGI